MPELESHRTPRRNPEDIEREAFEQGNAAGYAAGHAAGLAAGEKAGYASGETRVLELQNELQARLEELDAMLKDLATIGPRMVRETEPRFVELTVSIAQKILMRELDLKPEEIVRMAKESLLKLERTGRITIKVNPMLYDYVMKHKPDLERIHPELGIEPDGSVGRYGLVVLGQAEEVETDLNEQLKCLLKDMNDCIARE